MQDAQRLQNSSTTTSETHFGNASKTPQARSNLSTFTRDSLQVIANYETMSEKEKNLKTSTNAGNELVTPDIITGEWQCVKTKQDVEVYFQGAKQHSVDPKRHSAQQKQVQYEVFFDLRNAPMRSILYTITPTK